MTPKLYKAADVCDLAHLQPYVLRSWEKEFPGIGVQKTQDGPRVYRQSDVDQVLRIKQLVFGEGLTLAGARRRLEESPAPPPAAAAEDARAAHEPAAARSRTARSMNGATTDDARSRIASVREGLQSILTLLSARPATRGQVPAAEEYQLEPPATRKVRKLPARRPSEQPSSVSKGKRASA
jgi:DNA-binding transcriptional MerR regulator